MIGPSSGSGGEQAPGEDHHHHHKRRILEELDIDNLCDEVCGGIHQKRQRFLDEATLLFDQDANLQINGGLYDNFDTHQSQQHDDDGSFTRLEVLVVGEAWDEALESINNG